MHINVNVKVDLDELFRTANQFGDLNREKFDALVMTQEWKEQMADQMLDDFYAALEVDASGADEGIFADAIDYEDDDV